MFTKRFSHGLVANANYTYSKTLALISTPDPFNRSSFSPTVANPSAGGHLGGQVFEATCNCTVAHNYPYALGPRLGAAYQINSKTVINGGFDRPQWQPPHRSAQHQLPLL